MTIIHTMAMGILLSFAKRKFAQHEHALDRNMYRAYTHEIR